MLAPKHAGGVLADLVEDHVDGLVGLQIEVHRPLAIAVAEVERPGAVAFVANLGDGHLGPLTGRTSPDGSAFMDGDGFAPSADFEADFVGELGGDAVAAPPFDLLDIELGEDRCHPKRLTTSAGQGPALEGIVCGLGDGCLLVAADLSH